VVFEWLFDRLRSGFKVAIVETPAGFELNSEQVAGRVGSFLRRHLKNHDPHVTIVPARKRGTKHSPDDPLLAGMLPPADVIFMGPGSPTYAVRQLKDSLTWSTIVACHRQGVPLVLASAAAIAVSKYALPVYEIFKVGADLHWQNGLDLLGDHGLSLAIVPHWNNRDGGDDLDTSCCYMGQARFDPLLDMLPPHVTVVGIDEHTALVIDEALEVCRVLGSSGVSVIRDGIERRFETGHAFPIFELGPFRALAPDAGLPRELWRRVKKARAAAKKTLEPSPQVMQLLKAREAARSCANWSEADQLRTQVEELGWTIQDTPDGPQLEPL
jgi:hypothetical protein